MTNTNQHNPHPLPAMVPPPTDMVGLGVMMNEIRSHVSNIAVLHERQTNSEKRLADSERRNTEALTDIKQQLLRVHDRLDLMDSNVREEVSSVREEVSNVREDFRRASEQHRQETVRQIEHAVAPVLARADDAAKMAKDVRAELDGWINRVRGGWSVGSIVFGLFQSAVVAMVLWMGAEVKTMHDWRIQMEARQPDTRNDKRGNEISAK